MPQFRITFKSLVTHETEVWAKDEAEARQLWEDGDYDIAGATIVNSTDEEIFDVEEIKGEE
jgi:alanine dehydrogenase